MHKNSVDIRRCRRCRVVEMNVVVGCEGENGEEESAWIVGKSVGQNMDACRSDNSEESK